MLTSQKLQILEAIDAAVAAGAQVLPEAGELASPASQALEPPAPVDLAHLVDELEFASEDDAHARVRQLAKLGQRDALMAVARHFRGALGDRARRALDRLPEPERIAAGPDSLVEPEAAELGDAPELELEQPPVDPADVMGQIAKLEREDDVYALIRRWARRGNIAALETVATHASHTPLVAFVERQLEKLKPTQTA